jgi:arsenite methyltransferase
VVCCAQADLVSGGLTWEWAASNGIKSFLWGGCGGEIPTFYVPQDGSAWLVEGDKGIAALKSQKPTENGDVESDVWSEWLLHRRHADDPAYSQVVQAVVVGYADRVLDGGQLVAGMTLVDVGAGEGLLAFRAIDRIGPSLRVVLTDLSAPMLQYAESVAVKRNVRQQCTFLKCSADNLKGIADASVDVVATRAVLAYVADKTAALGEFFRILKPGGRLTIAEPILQDDAFYARALRRRIEDQSLPADRFLTLLHRWKAAQFPDTEDAGAKSPIANYSERDLLNMVRGSGFTEIHLQLHIDVVPSLITSWDVYLGSSPHPWAPSLKQILAEQFTSDERQFFEQMVRPTVESGKSVTTDRAMYLQAQRPFS